MMTVKFEINDFDVRELEELKGCYENAVATGFIDENEMTFEQYLREIPEDVVMEILAELHEEYMDDWAKVEIGMMIEDDDAWF